MAVPRRLAMTHPGKRWQHRRYTRAVIATATALGLCTTIAAVAAPRAASSHGARVWCGRDAQGRPEIPRNTDLPNFDSPYLGHTGSWDGKGGQADGTSKAADIANEVAMGLHWTFMAVYWSALEPNGPTDGNQQGAHPWAELDDFVALAHQNHMNVLMQAPVVGGNAGGPPAWAGTRVSGDSAPVNMQALANFAAKLVERYKPCGSLARERHWSDGYGVRAWEFDNEPSSYEVNWGSIPDDYAEAFTKVAAAIHGADRFALAIAPAMANPTTSGAHTFMNAILDKGVQGASPQYLAEHKNYAVGPSIDVVSFHVYELLDGAFNGADFNSTRVENEFNAIRSEVNVAKYEHQAGFPYAPKREFWHTEGGLDFLGFEPVNVGIKANWVIQFMARGFGAGLTRLVLMDAHQVPDEMVSIHTFDTLLPDPHSLREVTKQLGYDPSVVHVYRATDPKTGKWIYVAWAENQTTTTSVLLPVRGKAATKVARDGTKSDAPVVSHKVALQLLGLTPFSEPVFLVEK
jgi:hypothetical protein